MQLLVEADMDAQQVTGIATVVQWEPCLGSVSRTLPRSIVLKGWPSAHVQCHTPWVSLAFALN